MLDGTASTCVNHPGMEANYRCKVCGKPVCGGCVRRAPTGNFCSDNCQKKHEQFSQRAATLDSKGGSGLFVKLKGTIINIIIFVVALAVVGVIGSMWDIPVLSDLVFKVRGMLNM